MTEANDAIPGWVSSYSDQPPRQGDGLVIATGQALVRSGSGWLHDAMAPGVPLSETSKPVFLGELDGRRIFVARPQNQALPEEELLGLRGAMLGDDPVRATLASTACQVLHWQQDHRFCGRCGSPTRDHALERAKWCENCKIPFYPRIAPCVIVQIMDGDTLFLARSSRHRMHYFSLIAGFIEPGETAEQAVARETLEETGLRLRNIRYQCSQHWPFPHQLMLGFLADYDGGDICLQEDELAEAGWYRPADMPPVPPDTTIAGRLIESACAIIEQSDRGDSGK